MQVITIDDENYFRFSNLINDDNVKKLLTQDIDTEIKNNVCVTAPLYQTHPVLYENYKHLNHWINLYESIKKCVKKIIKKDIILRQSWANLSKENNNYAWHDHTRYKNILTCVYYLKSPYPEYGLKLENNIIIEAIENSLVCFKGKIKHTICNIPKHVFEGKYRYSLVFDFEII